MMEESEVSVYARLTLYLIEKRHRHEKAPVDLGVESECMTLHDSC